MKRNDVLLLCALLLIGVTAFVVLYAVFGGTGTEVVVTVGGEEVARLPLNKDAELVIQGYGGGTNLLVVEDGVAYIREASCPDQVCVHTGHADELKSVVCAPHRVVVRIESEGK